ncbi:hypothetical protein F4777DRAFT_241125 [Nemania sp. FL0916]|nr:hypothetical protein F4777DRAFT_241125 [Nemania sp. FL0916]
MRRRLEVIARPSRIRLNMPAKGRRSSNWENRGDGKYCGRCKMSTVEGTKEWEAVICPLKDFLVRWKKMGNDGNHISHQAAKTQQQEADPTVSRDTKHKTCGGIECR